MVEDLNVTVDIDKLERGLKDQGLRFSNEHASRLQGAKLEDYIRNKIEPRLSRVEKMLTDLISTAYQLALKIKQKYPDSGTTSHYRELRDDLGALERVEEKILALEKEKEEILLFFKKVLKNCIIT